MKRDLIIYSETIDKKTENQIYELISQAPFIDSKIRIMPDVHIGNIAVVGFTATITNKIIPNVIGSDIGCGMLTIELGKIEINYAKLDAFIRNKIPSGSGIHSHFTEACKKTSLFS